MAVVEGRKPVVAIKNQLASPVCVFVKVAVALVYRIQ